MVIGESLFLLTPSLSLLYSQVHAISDQCICTFSFLCFKGLYFSSQGSSTKEELEKGIYLPKEVHNIKYAEFKIFKTVHSHA